jgi:hypothetical protein
VCGIRQLPAEAAAGECPRCADELEHRLAGTPIRADPSATKRAGEGEGPKPSTWSMRRDDPANFGEDKRAWGRVRLGIILLSAGAILQLGAILLFLSLLAIQLFDVPGWTAAIILGLAFGGLQILSWLTGFPGAVLCCTLPRAAQAKGAAVSALTCLGTCIILFVLLVILPNFLPFGALPDPELLVALALLGIAAAGALSLSLVLRAAARYWGNSTLGGHFVACVIVFSCSVLLLMLFLAPQTRPEVSPYSGFLVGPIFCGLLVWLLVLLARLRKLIPAHQPAEDE